MSVSKMKSFPQTIYLNSHYQYYSWKMLQRKCQKKIFSLHSTNGKLKNNSKSYIYIYIYTHTHTHNPYYSRIPYCKFISSSLRFICNGKIHTPDPSARTERLPCMYLLRKIRVSKLYSKHML